MHLGVANRNVVDLHVGPADTGISAETTSLLSVPLVAGRIRFLWQLSARGARAGGTIDARSVVQPLSPCLPARRPFSRESTC